jgi:hypothetical protein
VERHVWGKPGGWFSDLFASAGVDATREWEGGFREWGADVGVIYQGRRQSVLQLFAAPNQEFFDGVTYQNMRYSFFGEVELWPDVKADLGLRWGETIDFDNSRQGEFVTWSPGLSWKLGRGFQGRFDWDRQAFDVAGGRLFTAEIFQTRLLYHFSLRTYVRAILQYRDTERNPALYLSPPRRRSETLLSQLLFSYKLNAQSVLLLGYSDFGAGHEALDLTRTNRTVFVKVGYAWLF